MMYTVSVIVIAELASETTPKYNATSIVPSLFRPCVLWV